MVDWDTVGGYDHFDGGNDGSPSYSHKVHEPQYNPPVKLEGEIIRETEKAILYEIKQDVDEWVDYGVFRKDQMPSSGIYHVWFPKSQIEDNHVPAWLYNTNVMAAIRKWAGVSDEYIAS